MILRVSYQSVHSQETRRNINILVSTACCTVKGHMYNTVLLSLVFFILFTNTNNMQRYNYVVELETF